MRRNSLFILSLLIAGSVFGQQQYTGISTTGIQYYDPYSYEKTIGLIASHRADTGVFLQTGNTNVMAWTDMTGNGFNWVSYGSTNQGSFAATFQTNALPVISFPGLNTTERMHNDSLSNFYTGNSNISWFATICAQTNSNNLYIMALGSKSAQSPNGSTFGMVPSAATFTTFRFNKMSDTNTTVVGSTVTSPGTNVFMVVGITYDGTTIATYCNKSRTTSAAFNIGTYTYNTCTLGGVTRTNFTFASQAACQIFEDEFFTNALSQADAGFAMSNMSARAGILF